MIKFRPTLLLLLFIHSLLALAGPAAAARPRQDQDPYPPSEQPELLQPTLTPDPYLPPAGNDGDVPAPIGEQDGGQSPQPATFGQAPSAQPEPVPTPNDRGLLFLWVGFLAAFLVFLTSIVGSIILFTRRNES